MVSGCDGADVIMGNFHTLEPSALNADEVLSFLFFSFNISSGTSLFIPAEK